MGVTLGYVLGVICGGSWGAAMAFWVMPRHPILGWVLLVVGAVLIGVVIGLSMSL